MNCKEDIAKTIENINCVMYVTCLENWKRWCVKKLSVNSSPEKRKRYVKYTRPSTFRFCIPNVEEKNILQRNTVTVYRAWLNIWYAIIIGHWNITLTLFGGGILCSRDSSEIEKGCRVKKIPGLLNARSFRWSL